MITNGLTVAQVRLANTAFATTFFPRVMRSVWPRVCGTTKSNSLYEDFAFIGAAPMMKLFTGIVESNSIKSYEMQVPNALWKNFASIKRNQFEFDQTKSLRAFFGQFGVRVSQLPDYLLARQMINGSAANSQTFVNPENGKSYQLTFDNKPIYSASHNTGGPDTFTNIITGHLPATAAAVQAQDLTVTANQAQQDVAAIIDLVAGYKDDKGATLYPDFDPEKQLVLHVPPVLYPGFELAFATVGTLGGTNGSSSGSTTNIGKKIVKDVISWNLLKGCSDPMNAPGIQTAITPTYPTQYYWTIDGDFVKPWYMQRFMPLKETIPNGYDPEAEAERIIREAGTQGLNVSPEAAEIYAATEVSTNFNAIGNGNAQEGPVVREEFFIGGRTRQMIFPGPWTVNGKVDPTGTSA